MELSKNDTQSIKGIAILLMLWHHLFLTSPEYGAFASSFAIVSKICVALFLLVSGYGLTKQYDLIEKRNLLNTVVFLIRRFVSFYLQYWFCFLLVVVVGNVFGFSFADAYPASRNTLKCLFWDFWGQMGYDSYLKPWWFNKMIIQLYILFPVLYVILRNCYFAFSGLFAIIIVQLYATTIPGNVFFLVEGGLPAFYLGMLLSRFQIIPDLKKKKWKLASQLVFIFLVVGILIFYLKRAVHYPYPALLLRALLALCVVFAYKSFQGHNTSVLRFFGKYSAIMYLTHVLYLVIIPNIIYYPKNAVLVFVLFSIICLGSAILIYWLESITHYNELRQALLSHIKYRK